MNIATIGNSTLVRNDVDLSGWFDSSAAAMGWLRSVGSIKLQVSFAEYCLFYMALLQNRPIIISILLAEATPYQQCESTFHGQSRCEWTDYYWQDIQQVFTGVPVHIKHVLTGVPKISNEFSHEDTECPSLKRSIRKTDRSCDPNIWSLISCVGGKRGYGVASTSRLFEILGLFCKRAL